MTQRRAAILPVVLFTVLLIALVGAVYGFRIHSDVASTTALADRMQSRLAAEAGVEWTKAFLRTGRFARSAWYHNPDAFHRMALWVDGEDEKVVGTNEEFQTNLAYRFSIVADDPTDDETYIRFGLTDEASKLNLNTATEAQLLKLVTFALGGNEEIDPQPIVDAILDWRDPDSKPRGEAADTEGEFYRQLPKPYGVKNANFDTVEELLLVKGVTTEILFGEDFDRNGLLTENEDDGDLSFPPDNQDAVLNRGLYPYVTAISYESDVAMDNRRRAYLLGPEEALRTELALAFPDEPDAIDFIVRATRKKQAAAGPGGDKPGEPQDPGGEQPNAQPDANGEIPQQPVLPRPERTRAGTQAPQRGPQGGPPGGGQPGGPPKGPEQKSIGMETGDLGGKLAPLSQLRDDMPPNTDRPQADPPRGGQLDPGKPDPENSQPDAGENPQGEQAEGQTPDDPKQPNPEGTGDGGSTSTPIRSPADLLFPRQIGSDLVPSPLTIEHLATLLDRTTVHPPDKERIDGLINVNTATRQVLECVEGLPADQIDAILTARDRLSDEVLATPAWLVSEGILDLETFAKIAPAITARAQQFSIESLGYADHQGMVTRLQVVVDMTGPIAQTIYFRDLTYLGASYPIREDDLEQQRAR